MNKYFEEGKQLAESSFEINDAFADRLQQFAAIISPLMPQCEVALIVRKDSCALLIRHRDHETFGAPKTEMTVKVTDEGVDRGVNFDLYLEFHSRSDRTEEETLKEIGRWYHRHYGHMD